MAEQLNHETIRRLRYYQLQSMLRLLDAPKDLLHKPVSAMKDWIVAYAQHSHRPNANEEAMRAFNAVKSGTPPAPAEQRQERVDTAVAEALVKFGEQLAALEKRIDERDAKAYEPIKIEGVVKPKKLKARPHAAFERVTQLASQRVNVLLVGPAGCGKTHLGKQAADALDLEFGSISCSAGMSESQLAGWLLPTGAGGKFEYAPSPFVSLYENGGLFLLDEIDSGDPNTLTFINKAIANDGFFVPQRLKQPFVKRHKDFVCLAAANTYGNGADSMYVGRNQLDAATLDRFRAGTVTMDYDRDLERELIHPQVLKWGWSIREKIGAQRLRRIMSTRVMLDLTKMTEAYKWTEKEWGRSYFSDWSDDERRRVTA
jgi:MoxR-like ATPase